MSSKELTSVQLSLERVITKTFYYYAIPLEISSSIRTTFKSKLWRMGKALTKLGGKKRPEQLRRWKEGPESVWNFTVNEAEVRHQLLKRKRQVEVQLEQQVTKRKKLEKEVNKFKRTNKQAKAITRLQTGCSEKSRGPLSSKVWNDYCRQHRSKEKRDLANGVRVSLKSVRMKGSSPFPLK